MRRFITFITALLVVSAATAQNDSNLESGLDQERHELKLNFGMAIQYDALELNYEFLFKEHITFGLGAYYAFKTVHNKVKYSLIPNVRFYPSKSKTASGFFIEANAAVLKFEEYSWNEEEGAGQYDDIITGGVGGAVGYKFRTCGDFIFEGYIGAGTILNIKEDGKIYPRLGLTVGKRF